MALPLLISSVLLSIKQFYNASPNLEGGTRPPDALPERVLAGEKNNNASRGPPSTFASLGLSDHQLVAPNLESHGRVSLTSPAMSPRQPGFKMPLQNTLERPCSKHRTNYRRATNQADAANL